MDTDDIIEPAEIEISGLSPDHLRLLAWHAIVDRKYNPPLAHTIEAVPSDAYSFGSALLDRRLIHVHQNGNVAVSKAGLVVLSLEHYPIMRERYERSGMI